MDLRMAADTINIACVWSMMNMATIAIVIMCTLSALCATALFA
jgi:hypothetical protein